MNQPRALLLLYVLLLTCAIRLSAQVPANEQRIRQDIFALAHDSMQGRGSATADELRAARYIESEFRRIGLVPYPGYSEGLIRPFSFGNYQFETCKLAVGSVDYESFVEFGAIAASADGSLEQGVLILSDSLLSNRSYVIRDSAPVALLDLEKHGGTKLSLKDCGGLIRQLENAGARAVILFHAPSERMKNSFFHPDSLPAFGIPVIYASKTIARELLEQPGANCSLEVKIKRQRRQSCNVLGYLDRNAEHTVVIGAHFDHVGLAKPRGSGGTTREIHNGADDNASGTAVVLELARWLSQQEGLKSNFLFVAFGSEEMGLHGSWNFCNSFPDINEISWMLNLDMVGRLGWNGKQQLSVLGLASSGLWKNILIRPEQPGLRLRKLKGAPGFSDHFPFVRKEIPVIYFTTGLHREYHTPADDPERINYEGISEILDYIQPFILRADDAGRQAFTSVSAWNNVSATLRIMLFR